MIHVVAMKCLMIPFFTLVGLPLSYDIYRAFMKESESESESAVLCTDTTALVNSEKFIGTTEYLTLQTKYINRCRHNRVTLYFALDPSAFPFQGN
jgi:hypothetical protein